jgi:hypothetical protein
MLVIYSILLRALAISPCNPSVQELQNLIELADMWCLSNAFSYIFWVGMFAPAFPLDLVDNILKMKWSCIASILERRMRHEWRRPSYARRQT